MQQLSRSLLHPVYYLLLFLLSSPSFAASPVLAFSDMISGPATGLGDDKGSGAIVTIWGYNLGASQGDSKAYFINSNALRIPVTYIYYWKDADGVLPSGPANLHASHGMQEVAISIPASANGVGTLALEVNGVLSNTLPFTVRTGDIFHVKSSGSDTNPGTYAAPWKTLYHATQLDNQGATAGGTVYIHDVDSGSATATRAIFWRNSSASSTLDAQFTIAAYPGFRPKATGQIGVEGYNTEAMVVSKLDIYASNYTSVSANDQPTGSVISTSPRESFGIHTTPNGRIIANRITDIDGGCVSAMSGAIMGSKTYASNAKIIGNEIYEYGCAGSSKLHHTTYMTIRSYGANYQVEPWEWGYNYLHDNHAKFGIHQFDQDAKNTIGCGDATGPVKIHNNVIVNQGGGGISIGSQCGWTMDFYIENNVIINSGLAAAWDGVDKATTTDAESGAIAIRDSGTLPNGGLNGTMHVRNNLIYNYGWSGMPSNYGQGCLTFNGSSGDNVQVEFANNICYSEFGYPIISAGYNADNKLDNISGSNNIFYYGNSTPISQSDIALINANSLTADPGITINGAKVVVPSNSRTIGAGIAIAGMLPYDIYGNSRGSTPDIGPAQYGSGSVVTVAPNPPTNVHVQ